MVVFESGLDPGGSLIWAKVQDEVSKTTSTASYDRAGIMWSERGNNPKAGEAIAMELYTLLKKDNLIKPYLLVGHSLIPLVVITVTSENRRNEYPTLELGLIAEKIWMQMQMELLELSTRSEHVLASKSSHFIQLEQPEIIIEAIRKQLRQVTNSI